MLLQIVDCGSIQGASRRMGVTRASLRRVLDSLEEEIGAPLFHRHGKGVELSAVGAVVVEQGRSLLEASRTLVRDARAASGEATGVLRVTVPVGIPIGLQAQLLMAGRRMFANQDIALRIVEDPLATADGPFDLLLHEGPPPDRSGWFSRVILRAPLRLCGAPSYLAERGTPTGPGDLARHDVIAWKRPGSSPSEWPLLGGGTVRVAPWLTSPDPQLVHTVVTSGGGIALLPDLPFIEHSELAAPVPLLTEQVGTELAFRASARFPIRTDARTRGPLQMLLERLAELPEG